MNQCKLSITIVLLLGIVLGCSAGSGTTHLAQTDGSPNTPQGAVKKREKGTLGSPLQLESASASRRTPTEPERAAGQRFVTHMEFWSGAYDFLLATSKLPKPNELLTDGWVFYLPVSEGGNPLPWHVSQSRPESAALWITEVSTAK